MSEIEFCYRTKRQPIKQDWQIKLSVIAHTNRKDFATNEEYQAYIEEQTKNEIIEQDKRLKRKN